jgi:hypothetical protein
MTLLTTSANSATLRYFLICVATVLLTQNPAHADQNTKIDVGVEVHGDTVIIDVSCFVPATPQEAWVVMTDYDNATRFISKLEKSLILARTDKMLLVSQKGTMGLGPFSATFESVTEIRLTPFERMRAHMVSGNMKKYEARTELIPEASGTRIVYHAESIPDVWIPPIIGRLLVEHETRARFQQLLDEILRRKP